jgi:hypothetical protein
MAPLALGSLSFSHANIAMEKISMEMTVKNFFIYAPL